MFVRSRHNPIFIPNSNLVWQTEKTYNPAIIFEKDYYHLFFRATGLNNVSVIGYAKSKNPESFKTQSVALEPDLPFESHGVEDPRITKINRTYFLTYTAYDGQCARLCLATSKNLTNWRKHGIFFNHWNLKTAGGFNIAWDIARQNKIAQKEWNKSGAIFPAKINGQYMMLFGDSNIWLATSSDGLHWQPSQKPFLKPRKYLFDNIHLEMGPPPIKTKSGWLVFYHGVNQMMIYRLGYLLLDLDNPQKILFRSTEPIFSPLAAYELGHKIDITHNKKPQVIFCNGAILSGNALRIYYGAGDKFVCTATAKLAEIINSK